MDAINKAVTEVYHSIPPEIINIGFNDNTQHAQQSVDETILSRVIRPRVLVDCNLVGGVEIYVPVANCGVRSYTYGTNIEYVIDVPKTLTGGRSIITPLGIFGNIGAGIKAGNFNTGLTQALSDQMNIGGMPWVISTSRLEMVGENRILVVDPGVTLVSESIKCVVENASNLSNISPRAYPNFSVLVVLAVKAYIYNQLIVKMGQGYIYNGHELGVVTDLINDYASANEDYLLYLKEVWVKVAFHNDRVRLNNFLAGMV